MPGYFSSGVSLTGVCDRIVMLNFGDILGAGTPAEIRAHPEVIAAYLGTGIAQSGPGAPMDRV